jgi:tRNA G26 N,N-dimethylase Trm1
LVPANAGVELSDSTIVCGPLWIGELGDTVFIREMQEQLRRPPRFQHNGRIQSVLDECQKYMEMFSKINHVQFIDVRVLKQRIGGAKLSMWAVLVRSPLLCVLKPFSRRLFSLF